MKAQSAKSRRNKNKPKQTHINVNFLSLLVAVQQDMTAAILQLVTKVNNLAIKHSEVTETSEIKNIKVNARNSET